MANNADKNKRQENSIKNPGAAVVIYNYKYRLGTPGLSESEAHEIDQVILNTVSLRKVSTSKSKSQPAGRFEILLAPTKNWVNTITPGSWCVILMSQEKINPQDTRWQDPKADINKVKMLGRIESVRAVTAVDQSTGAITTEYVVQGEDWGGVLNTYLYVDPLIRGRADTRDPFTAAERIIYDKQLVSFGNDGLPSSSENIQALLSFWGRTSTARSKIKKEFLSQGRLSESTSQFRFPSDLVSFFDFRDDSDSPSGNLADIINIISGKLTSKDQGPNSLFGSSSSSYDDVDDGAAPIMLDTMLGTNSFWQLIINNSNHWINDTYAEMRWEFNSNINASRPRLVVYNRIKPFAIKTVSELISGASTEAKQSITPTGIENLTSHFKNIRTHEIDRADLILVNVGTNWRDRYNFIEVNINSGLLAGASGNENYSAETKLRNQTFDEVAIGRDGFKPMIVNAKYIPKNPTTNELDPFSILAYKTMNREWFFNTHRMLNGSMNLVGQSQYVAVGDNIIIDADAVFPSRNINKDHIDNPGTAFLLAHIESVSHTCTVNENGARSFITEIQFVRGIITDNSGNQLGDDVHVDQNTSVVSPTQEINTRSFGTSSGKDGGADPDIQKLKGK